MSPVIWDRDMLARLKTALGQALSAQHTRFDFATGVKRSWWMTAKETAPMTFTIREARQKVAELEAEFSTPDQPGADYMEGEEGQ